MYVILYNKFMRVSKPVNCKINVNYIKLPKHIKGLLALIVREVAVITHIYYDYYCC